MELREKEAATAASEAEARRVRAEADQRAAEAQQLEVQAQRAGKARDAAAATTEEQLRRADALDPEVATDKEGNRLDEDGHPVETPAVERAAAGVGASAAAREHDHDHGPDGEHGHGHTHADDGDEPTGGRVGNMRDLDEDELTGGEQPDRGSSDEARAEHGQSEHRIGNMRGVDDDDQTTVTPATPEATEADETVAGDDTVGDGENDARDRARERADDVLAKRDAEAERRQPE